MKSILVLLMASVAAQALVATPAPENVELYFIEPADGAILTGPEIRVVFGLRGMGIAPAGTNYKNTGHHHLLVDLQRLPDTTRPLPKDSQHLHFGDGQTETLIRLEPGEHSLQLLLGDYAHIPHEPPVLSKRIRIRVR